MTMAFVLTLATMFLAYANGANDNFKGVATLFGCGAVSYKSALTLATIATFAGCIASVFVAAGLIKVFSGSGVVPPDVANTTSFMAAVAAGAAGTVMFATVTGLPISTTHSITGAMIGAGLVAVGSAISVSILGGSFFAPLLVSPILAVCLTAPLYFSLKWLKARFSLTEASCICVGAAQMSPIGPDGKTLAFSSAPVTSIAIGSEVSCMVAMPGQLMIARLSKLMDYAHYVSAAAVSFARGMNDTPKMIAMLLVLKIYDVHLGAMTIAIAIALGGLISAKRVAYTMSKKICEMEHAQALTANFVTALLVIVASRFGLPVSTTHVSVSAIFGVGIVNGTADPKVILRILASWVLTLPVATVIGATSYAFFKTVFSG
ncbi:MULTISPECIES: anion permease [unclassified Bradyrhizobium]|uniref:inorganic phosphate transporter n=1 Tax=unclassified Bradyrhizobium TaxID=2631580 RepID=UPI0028E6C168|nr:MULTISPECIES: anion permease [unclassified Bradyrhizobium]